MSTVTEGVNPLEQRVEDFVVWLEERREDNTVEAYERDLEQLTYFLSRIVAVAEWENVTTAHLEVYVAGLSEKGFADTTQARKVASIKSFFRFLVTSKVIRENPTESLDSPRVAHPSLKFLSQKDVTKLLATAHKSKTNEGQRDAVIMELLYATGLRVGELVSVNLQDLDLSKASIRCMGKGCKDRIIYLHSKALEKLKRYLRGPRIALLGDNRDQPALFVNHWGRRLTRQLILRNLKSCAQKAGITKGVTPSTLRHSLAIHMIQRGASLWDVKGLLGHSYISCTQIYARWIR